MKEVSRTKYYLAKYFFLVLGAFEWICALLVSFQFEGPKGLYSALVFIVLGFLFILLNYFVAKKLKRVAIGKRKLAIISKNNKVKSYQWSYVEFIKTIPLLNICKLRLKGKNQTIYFFTTNSMPHV